MISKWTIINSKHRFRAIGLGLGLWCLATSGAFAQSLARAPIATLSLKAQSPELPTIGQSIQAGQMLSRYQVTPEKVALIQAATPRRQGSYPEAIAKETVLFKVNLDNGDGYCVPLANDQGIRESQCFRDLNNDGIFDAGYVTRRASRGKFLYRGQLTGLSAIPPAAYLAGPTELIQSEALEYRLKEIKANKLVFEALLNNSRAVLISCDVNSATACRVGTADYWFGASLSGLSIVDIKDVGPVIEL